MGTLRSHMTYSAPCHANLSPGHGTCAGRRRSRSYSLRATRTSPGPRLRQAREYLRLQARLAVPLEIYTHEDRQGQKDALGKISDELQEEASVAHDGETGA